MNACEMIARCHRHQWPQDHGGAPQLPFTVEELRAIDQLRQDRNEEWPADAPGGA